MIRYVQESCCSPLITTFFVSVAANLGTGILGLPVSLHSSGFWPFLVTFTIALVAQLGTVFATTEIITRAHLSSECMRPQEFELITPVSLEESEAQEENTAFSNKIGGTSLHDLARNFIPARPLRFLFEFAALVHFVAILTSYGLAGPQALRPIFSSTLSPRFTICCFVSACTAVIIFFLHQAKSFLDIATAFKCSLLFGLVVLCLIIRIDSTPAWQTRWSQIMEPFLMGSVALGGVANVMPVTWGWCSEGMQASDINSNFVKRYRGVVCAAIITCYVCNLSWSYAVLRLVPQGMLRAADERGEIATVPLVAALKESSNLRMPFLVVLINSFTAVSVTVSFLVIGAGLRHMVDGMAETLSFKFQSHKRTTSGLLYTFWFGLILLLALTNPRGFMTLVESFTSFGLNLEGGFFMIYMFYQSRKSPHDNIPGELGKWCSWLLIFFAGSFFTVALLVDGIFFLPRVFEKL